MASSELEKQESAKKSKKELAKKYGINFPDPQNWKDGKAWRLWADGRRKVQEPMLKDKRVHYARHRHFRLGHQWISTRDGRLFREPAADENDIRIVDNQIGPALDFRLSIVAEQRPGFRLEPLGTNVEKREQAEAQQNVTEYYFHTLNAWLTWLDAEYNAQTDGAAFVHVFVDPAAGPKVEDVEYVPPDDPRYPGLVAQGYEVDADQNVVLPLEGDTPLPPGSVPRQLPLGDISERVLLAHEVFFNEEAKTVNGPVDRAKWAVIRRIRNLDEARIETGNDKLEGETLMQSESDTLDRPSAGSDFQRGLPPFPVRKSGIKEGVIEYLIYIAPDPLVPELERGYWVRIIGDELVESGDELPGGLIPLARFSDGSPDPQILPRPVMSDWIGDQVAINALKSLLTKHTRYFAGGRIMAQKNTLIEETYSAIVGSLVEYQGMKPEVFQPTSAGSDAWKLLGEFKKSLEDKTGYNDMARGRVSESGSLQDVSGRALLGARELFERTFGPSVRAVAQGGTEWARLIVAYAKFLFKDSPRMISVVNGRGDLARSLSDADLGEAPMVYVDAETMMPMPRAWRQQVLYESLQAGLISQEEYQSRAPYAEIKNMHMGQMDQWDRAQWVNTLLQEQWEQLAAMDPTLLYQGGTMPVLWQDDPLVHMRALSELVLDERKPWPLRLLAINRHNIYEGLSLAKMTPQIPAPIEVTGVPLEKQMMAPQQPAPQQNAPIAAPGTPPAGTGLPTPELTGAIPAESAPLGEFGNVERQ